MITWLLVGGVTLLALGLLAWQHADARHAATAAALHADHAPLLAEATPTTLHPAIDVSLCMGSGTCVRACPEDQVLGIVDGVVTLINPLACVGHGECLRACPTQAISLVFGTATRGVELPALSVDLETSQPGVFILGELAGMGLIRNAVAQGRRVAEALARRGKLAGFPYDAIIVGAGPAGIAAAAALRAHDWRVVLVEQATYGGAIRHYPRRKVVMTGSWELPGYGKVRGQTMTKEQLAALWLDVRMRLGLEVIEGATVNTLTRAHAGWEVEAPTWRGAAPYVLLALGRRGSPRRLGVPGEELSKVSYQLEDAAQYASQHVLVVGGGNAAADAALALVDTGGCASVAISYRRNEFLRMRPQVRARLNAALASGALIAHMGTELRQVGAHHVELVGPQGDQQLINDAVIVQIGGVAPDGMLRQLGIALVTKYGEA